MDSFYIYYVVKQLPNYIQICRPFRVDVSLRSDTKWKENYTGEEFNTHPRGMLYYTFQGCK